MSDRPPNGVGPSPDAPAPRRAVLRPQRRHRRAGCCPGARRAGQPSEARLRTRDREAWPPVARSSAEAHSGRCRYRRRRSPPARSDLPREHASGESYEDAPTHRSRSIDPKTLRRERLCRQLRRRRPARDHPPGRPHPLCPPPLRGSTPCRDSRADHRAPRGARRSRPGEVRPPRWSPLRPPPSVPTPFRAPVRSRPGSRWDRCPLARLPSAPKSVTDFAIFEKTQSNLISSGLGAPLAAGRAGLRAPPPEVGAGDALGDAVTAGVAAGPEVRGVAAGARVPGEGATAGPGAGLSTAVALARAGATLGAFVVGAVGARAGVAAGVAGDVVIAGVVATSAAAVVAGGARCLFHGATT